MQKKLNEDFIDSYCEKFASKITDSFFTEDKISITGKEILKVTPSKQANLFIVKLIFQYWQGESKKLESPFFNYDSDSVKDALVEFMNVLSQNIEIHKNRFQLLLNHAVKDSIYLAASPQAYLEIDLDGADVDKIDDAFIEENIKYIKIYKKEIQNFLSDMRGLSAQDAIDELADEFEPFDSSAGLAAEVALFSSVLPIKADQVLSESFPEDFDEYEDDEVFDNDEPSEPDEIDDNEARFQAAEKDGDTPADTKATAKEEMSGGMKWGDENDESSVEKSDQETGEEPGSDQQMTEPFEEESFETEAQADKPEEKVKEEAAAEDNAASATDETEQLEDVSASQQEEEQVEPEEKPANEEQSDAETINDQFEKPEKTVVEDLEEKKASSMMELISVNHQFMFVKELFKDDQVSFQNALYELEDYDTFDDAVEFLVQGYAKEFTWDMQSNEVKELLKVLFRKFRS
ncbi:MAG: hypothetical protein ABJP45_19095 [Cyclobacteriaceae bacterium]